MTRNARRRIPKISWTLIIVLFTISFGSFGAMMIHYNFSLNDISSLSFYQNLANPSTRVIQIHAGLRKEEIAEILSNKLEWDDSEKNNFLKAHLAFNSADLEGRYFPKTYLLMANADPSTVSATMIREFSKQTATIKKPKSTKVVNEETAVKIASIIQREAAGKSDMKLISGIIWNRLFSGMKLQVDATLQYAKGNEEDGWWESVTPADKKIDSPYNTYKYNSLPPTAIANPSLAALDAAYNPQKTSCLFFLHDKKRKIHCSTTYEEHKRNINKYY